MYRRLARLGFTRAYIRDYALPDWWDDAIGLSTAGYMQSLMILSRRLGVDFDSLMDAGVPVRFGTFGVPKYKLARDTRCEEVARVVAFASNVARTVCWTLREEPKCVVPSDGAEIRRALLESGAPCVGLENLLDWCWRKRIPVLHLVELPKSRGRKDIDGLAAMFHGRPAIVLCSDWNHPARLLFHLAHELGHIARNHLPSEGAVVDEGLQDHPASERLDSEEVEANRFALDLLGGASDVSSAELHAGDAASVLAEACAGPELIRGKLIENLDSESLSEETMEWILRITGARIVE